MKKHKANASKGNLYFFRIVCLIIGVVLLICTLKLYSHHQETPGLICLLFMAIFLLLIFIQKAPSVGQWLMLFGLVLILLTLLVVIM